MNNLKYFKEELFFDNATQFFKELNIPLTSIENQPFLPDDFLKGTYNADSPSHSLIDKIYFLGLVDDDALQGNGGNDSLEKTLQISDDYEGIAVVGIILKSRPGGLFPTRSQLAEITRAVNRQFHYTPVTVLFKYDNFLALANAERTSYLVKYKEGEKVGKVSLLRDINFHNPHSGHLQILAQLKIPATTETFKQLDKHWNDVFSVSLLNKRFYKELSNWYFWAVKEVRFPGEPSQLDASDKGKQLTDLLNEHKATNVIRLLTRLLFVWFLKEKKLIPEELFDKDFLDEKLLKDLNIEHTGLFQNNQKSTYYRAILQNLFFASLNCPIKPTDKDDKTEKRERGFKKSKTQRGADFEMRYEKEFKNPALFLELINSCVPFLNGGLFECLDVREEAKFVDGFSENMSGGNNLIVPDYLFFGFDETVDLSAEYGIKDKQTKQSAVKGLIRLLKSYKFTIDENTPVEEDVALDPELLGKVFENLLASYNPETKTTARKQTGSFYTPREIVNYMVDESLKEYLKTKMLDGGLGYLPFGSTTSEMFGNEERKGQLKLETQVNPYTDNEEELAQKLSVLFSYTEDQPFTDDEEIKKLISALDACKILDPACGSGAFPMGILQKMVHVLQKLDPENKHWKDYQKQKALAEMDNALETLKDEERKERIEDIEKSFDESINNPDYARKLFLIENCIYGVDIQPIATQISRLRFFISLVVDQKTRVEFDNFGIRPLPNLEAKFVTANTLIGIEKPQMNSLFDKPEVRELEEKLKEVRHRLFSAKTSKTKRNLKARDKELRGEIAELLSGDIGNASAQLLANWDPYDQNKSAKFFDPEWMFGLDNKNGGFFDIIIANPPYLGVKNQSIELRGILKKALKYSAGGDLYVAFLEKSFVSFLPKKGILTMIIPNKFFGADYGKKIRAYLHDNVTIKEIFDLKDEKVFETAQISTIVLLSSKYKSDSSSCLIRQHDKTVTISNLYDSNNKIQIEQNDESSLIINKLNTLKKLSDFGEVRTGIMGFEYWKMKDVILNNTSQDNSVKLYTNGNLEQYFSKWSTEKIALFKEKYICPEMILDSKYINSNTIRFFENTNKIIIRGVAKQLTSIYYEEPAALLVAVHGFVPYKLNPKIFVTILNSKLMNWFHLQTFYSQRIPQGSLKYPINFLASIPIATNDEIFDQLVDLFDIMMTSQDSIKESKNTRHQIDHLIYKLYQLPQDDISLIEDYLKAIKLNKSKVADVVD